MDDSGLRFLVGLGGAPGTGRPAPQLATRRSEGVSSGGASFERSVLEAHARTEPEQEPSVAQREEATDTEHGEVAGSLPDAGRPTRSSSETYETERPGTDLAPGETERAVRSDQLSDSVTEGEEEGTELAPAPESLEGPAENREAGDAADAPSPRTLAEGFETTLEAVDQLQSEAPTNAEQVARSSESVETTPTEQAEKLAAHPSGELAAAASESGPRTPGSERLHRAGVEESRAPAAPSTTQAGSSGGTGVRPGEEKGSPGGGFGDSTSSSLQDPRPLDSRPAAPVQADLSVSPEQGSSTPTPTPTPTPTTANGATVSVTAEAESAAPLPEVRAPQLRQAAEILQQVRVHIRPDLHRAEIRLEPESLGRISIRIETKDGRVSALLTVERPEALQALERHVPELRAALADQGLRAEDIELTLSSDARDFGRADEQRTHEGQDSRTDSRARVDLDEAPADPLEDLDPQLTPRLGRTLGVDTYA